MLKNWNLDLDVVSGKEGGTGCCGRDIWGTRVGKGGPQGEEDGGWMFLS